MLKSWFDSIRVRTHGFKSYDAPKRETEAHFIAPCRLVLTKSVECRPRVRHVGGSGPAGGKPMLYKIETFHFLALRSALLG